MRPETRSGRRTGIGRQWERLGKSMHRPPGGVSTAKEQRGLCKMRGVWPDFRMDQATGHFRESGSSVGFAFQKESLFVKWMMSDDILGIVPVSVKVAWVVWGWWQTWTQADQNTKQEFNETVIQCTPKWRAWISPFWLALAS